MEIFYIILLCFLFISIFLGVYHSYKCLKECNNYKSVRISPISIYESKDKARNMPD